MPRLSARTALLAALVPALAACGDREPSPSLAERAAALSAGMNVDTLIVEGTPEAITFNEMVGSSFPVPFAVRVPTPLRVGRAEDADGDAVSFRFNEAPADAEVTVTALPEGTDAAAAQAQARRVAEALGTATDGDASAPPWAVASFTTQEDGRAGYVWLGERGGRFFTVASDSAVEATNAFAPRRTYLLEHWTWTDDGSALLSQ